MAFIVPPTIIFFSSYALLAFANRVVIAGHVAALAFVVASAAIAAVVL